MREGRVDQILKQVEGLSPSERFELLQALKRLDNGVPSQQHVPAFGALKHLAGSGEEFIRRKAEDLDLEERSASR
jgi:hypothetical protein